MTPGLLISAALGPQSRPPILTHLPQMGSDIQIFTLLHYAHQQGHHYSQAEITTPSAWGQSVTTMTLDFQILEVL